MLRHAVVLTIAGAGALTIGAAAANASTISVVKGKAVFTAAAGEVNDVRMSPPFTAPMTLTVSDAGAILKAGPGCTRIDSHTAYCSESSGGQLPLDVSVGDRGDRVTLDDQFFRPIAVHGGNGNDTLYVSSNNGTPAQIDGGSGDDVLTVNEQLGSGAVLRGNDGDDTLLICCQTTLGGSQYGGDGDDTLIWAGFHAGSSFPLVLDGGGDDDTYIFRTDFVPGAMVAGPGVDTLDETTASPPGLFYSTFTFDLNSCPACVERVIGTPWDDTISGDARAQTILGGDGADVLSGGGARDTLGGGEGDDTIAARDGAIDIVSCGDGVDAVDADRIDLVSWDCENVTRPASGA
jgi:hypothetical protein